VNGSREIARLTRWIFDLRIDLDIGIYYGQDMIKWLILMREQKNMSVQSLLSVVSFQRI
jgi:hypothetical protein